MATKQWIETQYLAGWCEALKWFYSGFCCVGVAIKKSDAWFIVAFIERFLAFYPEICRRQTLDMHGWNVVICDFNEMFSMTCQTLDMHGWNVVICDFDEMFSMKCFRWNVFDEMFSTKCFWWNFPWNFFDEMLWLVILWQCRMIG